MWSYDIHVETNPSCTIVHSLYYLIFMELYGVFLFLIDAAMYYSAYATTCSISSTTYIEVFVVYYCFYVNYFGVTFTLSAHPYRTILS